MHFRDVHTLNMWGYNQNVITKVAFEHLQKNVKIFRK
jgi:hypothetical protein